MAYKRDHSGYEPIITEYNVKDSPVVITLDVNANNGQSQVNLQSTDINNYNTFVAVDKT